MPSSASPSPSPRLSKGIWSRALKDMKCKVGMSLTFIELVATSPTAGVLPLLPPSARASSPLLPPRKVILAAIDRFSAPLSKIEQERSLRHDPNNTKREEDNDTKEDTNCTTMKKNRSAFSMAVFERIMLLVMLYSVFSRSILGILVAWLILAVVRPSLPARAKKLRRTKKDRRCCEADPGSFFQGQKVKEDELRKKQSRSLTLEHPGGFFQSQPMEQKRGARHCCFQNPSKSSLRPSSRGLTIQVPRQVWTAADESWRDTSLRRIGSNSPAIKLSNRNFSSLSPPAVKDMGHACCAAPTKTQICQLLSHPKMPSKTVLLISQETQAFKNILLMRGLCFLLPWLYLLSWLVSFSTWVLLPLLHHAGGKLPEIGDCHRGHGTICYAWVLLPLFCDVGGKLDNCSKEQ